MFLLGHALDQGKINKIISGAYVDLGSLRDKRDRQAQLKVSKASSTPQFSFAEEEEEPVTSFTEWLQLFLIYSSVRGQRYPAEGPAMATYIQRIMTIQTSKGGFVWREYDREFRRARVKRPSLKWEVIRTDILYHIPHNSPSPRPFRESEVCRNYNNNRCTRGKQCPREHSCSFCKRRGHPRVDCRGLANQKNQPHQLPQQQQHQQQPQQQHQQQQQQPNRRPANTNQNK